MGDVGKNMGITKMEIGIKMESRRGEDNGRKTGMGEMKVAIKIEDRR